MTRRLLPLLLTFTACAWLRNVPQNQIATYEGLVKIQAPALIIFDLDFPEEDQQIVRAAAAYLNALTGKSLFVMAPYAVDFGTVVVVDFEASYPDDPARPDRTEIAVTRIGESKNGYLRSATVTFFNLWFMSAGDGDRATTARHELLHVLGLDHTDDPKCILYPDILPSEKPKEACPAETNLVRKIYRTLPYFEEITP